MSRLILVANRLPLSVRRTAAGVEIVPSAGGLASALRGQRRSPDDIWIGWPGSTSGLDAEELRRLDCQLAAHGAAAVHLDDAQASLFYDSFANGVLWPLFHYVTGVLPLRVRGWAEYRAVNELFADAVVERYRSGDHIWIHDYHLLLLPALLRARLPDAVIGFFLHTPFPTSELFSALPAREELLHGLLGADLIGFHTASYRRHFASSVENLIGIVPRMDRVRMGERQVKLGVFPIGVDAVGLQRAAQSPAVLEEAERLRGEAGGRLLVGIDRLDYTKGIPRRLLALEELLVRRPEWRGAVRLLQICVPTREDVSAYRDFRNEVDGLVGRINGTFGTPHWMPVHYLYRSIGLEQLLAIYRAADVMLVTPVRDGMNLVAKEFVAARSDEEGVLVLSEFAGAAAELQEALLVNPYDIEYTADAIHAALTMEREERRWRMRTLRRRVSARDVQWWAGEYLGALADAASRRPGPASADPDPSR